VAPADTNAVTPSPSIPTDTVVASLSMTGRSSVSIQVGQTVPLIVRPLNRGGEVLPTARLSWEPADTTVATVDTSGVLTGIGLGRTSVVVRGGGRYRTIQVEVGRPTTAHVVIATMRDSLEIGETVTATAQAVDRRDEPLDQPISWRSTSPAVVTVDDGGVVRAMSLGRATLVASAGSASDSMSVTVVPVSQSAADSVSVASASVRAIATPRGAPSRGVAPREVGASSTRLKVPSSSEARAVADSVIQWVTLRQTDRLAQLTSKTEPDPGVQFQRFVERNHPLAALGSGPSVGDVRSTGATVAFSVQMQWRTLTSRRERTVNIEAVLDAVRGGWSIRELRFPGGFTQ
jgi:hypothetical protein